MWDTCLSQVLLFFFSCQSFHKTIIHNIFIYTSEILWCLIFCYDWIRLKKLKVDILRNHVFLKWVFQCVFTASTKELQKQSWATSKGLECVCLHSHRGACGNTSPGSVITMLEWHFSWLSKLYFWARLPVSIPRAYQTQKISFLWNVWPLRCSPCTKERLSLWTVGILHLNSCWKCATLRKSWPWGYAGSHQLSKKAMTGNLGSMSFCWQIQHFTGKFKVLLEVVLAGRKAVWPSCFKPICLQIVIIPAQSDEEKLLW